MQKKSGWDRLRNWWRWRRASRGVRGGNGGEAPKIETGPTYTRTHARTRRKTGTARPNKAGGGRERNGSEGEPDLTADGAQ